MLFGGAVNAPRSWVGAAWAAEGAVPDEDLLWRLLRSSLLLLALALRRACSRFFRKHRCRCCCCCCWGDSAACWVGLPCAAVRRRAGAKQASSQGPASLCGRCRGGRCGRRMARLPRRGRGGHFRAAAGQLHQLHGNDRHVILGRWTRGPLQVRDRAAEAPRPAVEVVACCRVLTRQSARLDACPEADCQAYMHEG